MLTPTAGQLGNRLIALASQIDDAAALKKPTALSRLITQHGDAIEDACDVSTLRHATPETQGAALIFADALADALHALAEPHHEKVKATLAETVGETGLMLSGGGKLGNYHIGVIRVLHQAGLLPRVISGSSAGSIMAAMIGTRTDAELRGMLQDDARALIADAGGEPDYDMTTLDQSRVQMLIARIVPDMTFAEALAASGRSINIAVARARAGQPGMVLNADNAANVLLRDAVLASCAVPYVYAPVTLRTRDSDGTIGQFANGVKWVDGSVYADMPARFLREHYGVTRLIASVVNPVELPFLTDPDLHGEWLHNWASLTSNIMRTSTSLGLSAMLPFMRRMPMAGRILALSQQVLDQRIEADVIIAPGSRFFDPMTLLQQASPAQMVDFITEGEAATMARLHLIEPALRIEAALRPARVKTRAASASGTRQRHNAGDR